MSTHANPTLSSSGNITLISLSTMITHVNKVVVPTGGSVMYQGPSGMGKTQANVGNIRDQQALDANFGGSVANLANYEAIDMRGLPQVTATILSEYGMPPWLHPIPSMGLRGAFPALCPEDMRGPRKSWSKSLAYAYDTAAQQLETRRLIPYSRGIVVLDECLQVIEESVLLSLAQLFDEHRIGAWGVPTIGWGVVGLTNRMQDMAGVREVHAHTRNRIAILEVENDPEACDDHWRRIGLNACFRYFAQAEPNTVFAKSSPTDQSQFCTARSWHRAHTDVMAYLMNQENIPEDELADHLIDHHHPMIPIWIASRCGTSAAIKFMDFVRNLELRPSFQEIMKGPLRAKLPAQSAVIRAVVEMLVDRADLENLNIICAYVMREEMPTVMQGIFCMRLARRMSGSMQSLFKHKKFMELVNMGGPSTRQLLFGMEHEA
jgi:hypothetical protein